MSRWNTRVGEAHLSSRLFRMPTVESLSAYRAIVTVWRHGIALSDEMALQSVQFFETERTRQLAFIESFGTVFADSTVNWKTAGTFGGFDMIVPTLLQRLDCLSHVAFAVDSIADDVDDHPT